MYYLFSVGDRDGEGIGRYSGGAGCGLGQRGEIWWYLGKAWSRVRCRGIGGIGVASCVQSVRCGLRI